MSTLLRKELCRSWRLYVITCPESLGLRPLAQAVEEAVLGGAGVVQLRDKTADDWRLVELARRLLRVTRRHGVPLIVNDRVSVAKEAGADGVHLGQEDGSLADARRELGEKAIIGRSTHSPEEALEAEREGFDYIGIGPVFPTPTKAGRPAVGLELVRFAAQRLTTPFVAIGGIDESNLADVLEAGASRVAVVRAVMARPDPRDAARRLLDQMTGHKKGSVN